nr:hypothetical protein [Salmonella bongori serovar 66:z65:-]
MIVSVLFHYVISRGNTTSFGTVNSHYHDIMILCICFYEYIFIDYCMIQIMLVSQIMQDYNTLIILRMDEMK